MRNHNPMPGSRYKDSHGAVVTVQRVEHNRVTFTARAISRHVFSLWRDSLMSSWRCAVILNEPAAQKEAFNLASLLTNVNPQNLIKPKVVNDYLLSIVMAKDLAKLSLNLSKPDIHARGMTTNDDILNQEIITSKKLIVGNKFPCWLVV